MSTQVQTLTQSSSTAATAKNIGLWVLQLGAAFMFFQAGYHKVSGDPMMVGLFDAIGIGQWFRYLTGGIEIVSAVLLLTPWFSAVGAALLVPTMIGAVLTHLLIIGGNPSFAVGLLVAVAIVAYGRREQIVRLFRA